MTGISRRGAIFCAAVSVATRLLPAETASAISARAYCPSGKEKKVLKLLNAHRRKRGRSKLKMDRALGAAARHHANDMARRGYFEHISPNGDDPKDRARKHGYRGGWIGENIARGQDTPQQVMNTWKRSAGHNQNMLRRRFEAVGIGYDPRGDYWVQVFGDEFFEAPACSGRRRRR